MGLLEIHHYFNSLRGILESTAIIKRTRGIWPCDGPATGSKEHGARRERGLVSIAVWQAATLCWFQLHAEAARRERPLRRFAFNPSPWDFRGSKTGVDATTV